MSAKVSYVTLIPIADFMVCFLASGRFPTFAFEGFFHCFFFIPFDELNNWNMTEFDIYRRTSLGTAPPFFVAPGIFPGGTYPNTVSASDGLDTVAAAVDCDGLPPAAPLRWVWEKQIDGICSFVADYHNREICSAQGINRNNDQYQSATGEVMLPYYINYDVFCPS